MGDVVKINFDGTIFGLALFSPLATECSSSSDCPWIVSSFIVDSKLLRETFDQVIFSWINRAGNKLAHLLSRRGLMSRMWSSSRPAWLEGALLFDVPPRGGCSLLVCFN